MKTFTRLSACVLFVFYMCTVTSRSQNNGFVSMTIDPLMLIEGPYSKSDKGELDFIISGAFEKGVRSELGVYFEYFNSIDYRGYGVFYNYKFFIKNEDQTFDRWEFVVGPQLGVINRNLEGSKTFFNTAVGGGVRYFLNNKWGVLVSGDLRYRPDLKYYYNSKDLIKHNAYVGVIYHW